MTIFEGIDLRQSEHAAFLRISPCKLENEDEEAVIRCTPGEASFFTIYYGGPGVPELALADFDTMGEAEAFARNVLNGRPLFYFDPENGERQL